MCTSNKEISKHLTNLTSVHCSRNSNNFSLNCYLVFFFNHNVNRTTDTLIQNTKKCERKEYQMLATKWKKLHFKRIYLPYHCISTILFWFNCICMRSLKRKFGMRAHPGLGVSCMHDGVRCACMASYSNSLRFSDEYTKLASPNEIFRWENFSIYHCIRVWEFFFLFFRSVDPNVLAEEETFKSAKQAKQ